MDYRMLEQIPCEYEVRQPQPNDDGNCDEPSIALVTWGRGDDMNVCGKHLALIRAVEEKQMRPSLFYVGTQVSRWSCPSRRGKLCHHKNNKRGECGFEACPIVSVDQSFLNRLHKYLKHKADWGK